MVERTNGIMATAGAVVQAAAGSIMTKEGGEHFTKLITTLSGE